MARISGATVIHRKIAELNRQINHFEECMRNAGQNVITLQQALSALESEPFSLPVKPVRKSSPKTNSNSSERIAKVFKHFPNQWLSAKEIMLRAFEIEGKKSRNRNIIQLLRHYSCLKLNGFEHKWYFS